MLLGLRKGFNLFKGGQPLRHEGTPQKFSITNLKSNFAPPKVYFSTSY